MSKNRRRDIRSSRMPPQPTDCRDAIHWFVDNYGLYTGSVRGLFISDFTPDHEAVLESAIINLRSRGVEPFAVLGDQLYIQSKLLYQQASERSQFGQPMASQLELDLLGAEVAIIKELEAPLAPADLWYLYHYVLYLRALFGKATIITTPLGVDEFIAYGTECDDFEFAGRKVTWDKLVWLIEASLIDLHQFRQVKTEGLPPMLKAEYSLFNAIKEREMPVIAQQVLGDYVLDMAIADRDNRLAIEVDTLASLDPDVPHSGEAKKNLVLLSDGWKILRFTTSEILDDLIMCVDAVEQTWTQGRKKVATGRLLSGRAQTKIPELPVDDDNQKLAITHGAGPVAITGGAGTGKSSCITHRVGYLLAQGVCPERVLIFSHSDETVNQLKKQMTVLSDATTVARLNFSNWRDLGMKILKENASAIKRKPPLKVESNHQRVLERVFKKVKKELDPMTLELLEEDVDELSMGLLLSIYKANLITPAQVEARADSDAARLVARVFEQYEDQLKKSNKVDNDDMISLCAQLLADDPEVRSKYEHKYEFVLVDEYQDCTAAQDLMARLLAAPQDNLFLAGDEDEAICQAKGALPHELSRVSLRLPNARCHILDKNWRSHPAIVDHSKSLCGALTRKTIKKDMVPGFGQAATSAIIGPQKCKNELEEAEWVANEVEIIIGSGRRPADILLLWRHQKYAALLEEALFRKNIRCLTSGLAVEAIPDEVGDVMAFLRLVMDPDGPKARASFERFCQLKSREMDQKLSKLSNTIASFAEANNLSFLKAIEIYHDATADSSCEDLAQLVRIVRTMNQENLPPAQTIGLLKRTQRLHDLYSSVKIPAGVVYEPMRKVEQLEEEAKEYKTVGEFVKAKQELMQPAENASEDASVHIKSFEDSKGSECPIVFLSGMAEGLMPLSEIADFEEERRLCYVGMTRAQEFLYISYPDEFEGNPLPPSPFLVEARLLPINVYKRVKDMIETTAAARAASQKSAPPEVPPAEVPGAIGIPAPGLPAEALHVDSVVAGQDDQALLAQRKVEELILQKQEEAMRKAAEKRALDEQALQRSLELGLTPEELEQFLQQGLLPQQILQVVEQEVMKQKVAFEQAQQQGLLPASHDEQQRQADEQRRLEDEAKFESEREAKLKAQYQAHQQARKDKDQQDQETAQRRAEQEAELRRIHEEQLRAQHEADLKRQEEERLKAAQEAAEHEAQHRAIQEARIKAQQEAELRAQQEAAEKARKEQELLEQQEREAELRKQEEILAAERARVAKEEQERLAREEEERLAKDEQERLAREERERIARQQQIAQEQQALAQQKQPASQQDGSVVLSDLMIQYEQHIIAAQNIVETAKREAPLHPQREFELKYRYEEHMRAAQEIMIAAQQEEELRAYHAAQAVASGPQVEPENKAKAEQEQQAQAEQEAKARAEEEARATAEQEATRAKEEQRIKAEQEARAKADEEQRAKAEQQSAASAQSQPAAGQSATDQGIADDERARRRSVLRGAQESVADEAERKRAEEELRKVVDEQFNFGVVTGGDQAESTSVSEAAEKAPTADELMVRSNKEILEEMSPEEREKQQALLKSKARDRLKAKGKSKKGAVAEDAAVEPVQEKAPAAKGKGRKDESPSAEPVVSGAIVSEAVAMEPPAVLEEQSAPELPVVSEEQSEIVSDSPEPVTNTATDIQPTTLPDSSTAGSVLDAASAGSEAMPSPAAEVIIPSTKLGPAELAALPTQSAPSNPAAPKQMIAAGSVPDADLSLKPMLVPSGDVHVPAQILIQSGPPRQGPQVISDNLALQEAAEKEAAKRAEQEAAQRAIAEREAAERAEAEQAAREQQHTQVPPPDLALSSSGQAGGPPQFAVPPPDLALSSSDVSEVRSFVADSSAPPPPPISVPSAAPAASALEPGADDFLDSIANSMSGSGVSSDSFIDDGPPGDVRRSNTPVGPDGLQASQGSGATAGVAPQEPVSFTEMAQPLVVPGTTTPMCPNCSAHLEAGARFCGECGLQMEVRIPACPGCSVPVEPGAKFCGECGFPLQRAQ